MPTFNLNLDKAGDGKGHRLSESDEANSKYIALHIIFASLQVDELSSFRSMLLMMEKIVKDEEIITSVFDISKEELKMWRDFKPLKKEPPFSKRQRMKSFLLSWLEAKIAQGESSAANV